MAINPRDLDPDLVINLNDREKASGDVFEPLPIGKYHLRIVGGDMKGVKDTKTVGGEEVPNPNAGKFYYNLDVEVVDGPLKGRRDSIRAMLFDGAAYTIVGLLKGLGVYEDGDTLRVPKLKWFFTKEVIGRKYTKRNGDVEWSSTFLPVNDETLAALNGAGGPTPAGGGKITASAGRRTGKL